MQVVVARNICHKFGAVEAALLVHAAATCVVSSTGPNSHKSLVSLAGHALHDVSLAFSQNDFKLRVSIIVAQKISTLLHRELPCFC